MNPQPYPYEHLPSVPLRYALLTQTLRSSLLLHNIQSLLPSIPLLSFETTLESFHIIHTPPHHPNPSWSFTTLLDSNDRIFISVDLHIALGLLDASFGQNPLTDRRLRPLGPTEHSLLLALLSQLALELSAKTQRSFQVEPRSPLLQRELERICKDTPCAHITLRTTSQTLTGHIQLFLPLPIFDTLSATPPTPILSIPKHLTNLPTPLSIRLCTFKTPPSTLQHLQPNAVLVTPHPTPNLHATPITLTHAHTPLFTATTNLLDPSHSLTLQPHQNTPMTTKPPANTTATHTNTDNPSPSSQNLSNLPLEITLELGRKQLTLAQLATLQVGDILTLDEPLKRPVDLVVHSHIVAQGELVDVDGRLGVRIAHVSPLTSPPQDPT